VFESTYRGGGVDETHLLLLRGIPPWPNAEPQNYCNITVFFNIEYDGHELPIICVHLSGISNAH